jgi:hypothetical protein
MATHIYTIVAVNYLPKARVLAESIKQFHPGWTIHVILCDAKPEWLFLEKEPFDSLLTLEELGIPDLPSWTFKHNLVELSTAVKGFTLQKILARPDCTEVFYFDPDIVVLAPLTSLVREFETASILLTPHSTEPETDRMAIADNELTALRHGVFNLGFIGVKNSEEGRRFASWWRDRLQEFCYNDVPRGLFTDQRWADMVPAYFPDHKILRDPGYNVSTWNLTHRTVNGSAPDGLLVNGQPPLVFYHFSGFDSGAQLGMLKKYGSAMPALFELRKWYIAACERHGQGQLSQWPWAYGAFDNGEPILDPHRKRYREMPEGPSRFPNPYATQEGQSYLHWFDSQGRLPSIWDRRLQLFWRAPGKDFSEENSFITAPLGVERQTVRLCFPALEKQPLEELRLDLSSHPGPLLLHQISLLNSQDETIWNWGGDLSFWESVKSTQICLIGPAQAVPGALLYLTGDDPSLILPIPASLLTEIDSGGTVAVDLTIGTPEDYLPDLAAAVQSSKALTESLRAGMQTREAELAERNVRVVRLETEVKRLRLESERLQNSLSWRATKPLRTVTKLGRKLLSR